MDRKEPSGDGGRIRDHDRSCPAKKENGEADLEKLPDLKELLDMYKSELIEEGFTEERLQKAYNLILAI